MFLYDLSQSILRFIFCFMLQIRNISQYHSFFLLSTLSFNYPKYPYPCLSLSESDTQNYTEDGLPDRMILEDIKGPLSLLNHSFYQDWLGMKPEVILLSHQQFQLNSDDNQNHLENPINPQKQIFQLIPKKKLPQSLTHPNDTKKWSSHLINNHSGVIFLMQQSYSSHLSIFPSLLTSTLAKNSSYCFCTIFLLKYLCDLSSSLIQAFSYFLSRTLLLSLSCLLKMSYTNFLQQMSICLFWNYYKNQICIMYICRVQVSKIYEGKIRRIQFAFSGRLQE